MRGGARSNYDGDMPGRPIIHLVDGTYELFRSFFGAPPSRAPDGQEVGATRGVLSSLLYLLQEEGATHVACATDQVIRSFRNDLYAGYKTEEGVEESLLAQFPLHFRYASRGVVGGFPLFGRLPDPLQRLS